MRDEVVVEKEQTSCDLVMVYDVCVFVFCCAEQRDDGAGNRNDFNRMRCERTAREVSSASFMSSHIIPQRSHQVFIGYVSTNSKALRGIIAMLNPMVSFWIFCCSLRDSIIIILCVLLQYSGVLFGRSFSCFRLLPSIKQRVERRLPLR
jgi:hypothetical protein